MSKLNLTSDDIEDLRQQMQGINSASEARIRDLEARNAHLIDEQQKWLNANHKVNNRLATQLEHAETQYAKAMDRAEAAEARAKVLEEALREIDLMNHITWDVNATHLPEACPHCIARTALQSVAREEGET